MTDLTPQIFSGEAWLDGRLQFNYLSLDKLVAESVAYHLNGKMRSKYPIYNNEVHGVGRCWFASGDLQCEEIYVHNLLHGTKREWHSNKKLRAEINYKRGILEGESKYWHENSIQEVQSYYKEGRLNGKYLEWWNNGRLRNHFNFVNGRRHGIFKYFRLDEKIEKEEAYIRGVRVPNNLYKSIHNGTITANDILGIRNAEIRRICLEQLGYERFLSQVSHQVIEKKGEHELVKFDWHRDEEPICLVKVKCPSTGTFYTLRVPPDMKTIKQAIAWTFWLKANQYHPENET